MVWGGDVVRAATLDNATSVDYFRELNCCGDETGFAEWPFLTWMLAHIRKKRWGLPSGPCQHGYFRTPENFAHIRKKGSSRRSNDKFVMFAMVFVIVNHRNHHKITKKSARKTAFLIQP